MTTDVYRSLERGDLTTDHVKAFGIGTQTTPLGLEVKHACPECPLGHPRSECGLCAGHGTVDERRLAQYAAAAGAATLLR